ncbi:hypothetical protein CRYUN_Cryun05aG0028200 [Craigia yunnanensis]
MVEMKEKFEKAKRLVTHKIDICELKPGDHIYAYRGFRSYTHHGIYVGEDRVIHFIQTEIDSLSELKPPCAKCGYQHNVHLGVVRTCLDCFLSDNAHSSDSLRLYQYEESSFFKRLKISGTCSTSKCCLPPETVVHNANELHNKNGFGRYDLLENNCEHFATFCKTGIPSSEQVHGFMSIPTMPSLVKKIKNKIKLSSR